LVRVRLPIQEAIRDLTHDLLGVSTTVDKTTHVIEPGDVGAVVSYRDDEGAMAIAGIFDTDLVGVFGAALTMVPPSALEEAREQGELPENVVENFWEVTNILASTLNRPDSPHVVQADRHRTMAEAGDDLLGVVDAPHRMRIFEVEGYGTGRMALYSASR
jgi:hypothetical protein